MIRLQQLNNDQEECFMVSESFEEYLLNGRRICLL